MVQFHLPTPVFLFFEPAFIASPAKATNPDNLKRRHLEVYASIAEQKPEFWHYVDCQMSVANCVASYESDRARRSTNLAKIK